MKKGERIFVYSIIALIFIFGAYAAITNIAQREGFHDPLYTRVIKSADNGDDTLDIKIDPTNGDVGEVYGNVIIAPDGGNVGIGTADQDPSEKLEVVGNILLNGELYNEGELKVHTNKVYVCFSGDTTILTEYGNKKISEIKRGDHVLSYDLDNNKYIYSNVLDVMKRKTNGYYILNDDVKVTSEHPFYTSNGWKRVRELNIGDKLLSLSGWIILKSKEFIGNKIDVYNMHVDGPHNYFAEGYLVHNKPNPGYYVGEDVYVYGSKGDDGKHVGNVILAHDGSQAIGNVAIGTNDPQDNKLYVAGDIKASGDICTSTQCLNSVSGGSSLWTQVSGNENIYRNSGDVGIGTNNPKDKLHVYLGSSGGTPNTNAGLTIEDSGTAALQILTPSDRSGGILFGDDSSSISGSIQYSHSSNSMSFHTNGDKRVTIDDVGNVGIGTDSPSKRLEVNGEVKIGESTLSSDSGTTKYSLRITNNNGYVDIGPKNTGGAHIYTDRNLFYFNKPIISGTDSSSSSIFSAYNTKDLKFATNSGNDIRMVIKQDSGNVGIGTDDPGAKLEVKGGDVIIDLS